MNVEQVMQGLRFFKLSSLGADFPSCFEAGDRIRTGDVQLGKLTFYH